MSDYIARQAAKRLFADSHDYGLARKLDEIPAADVVEVVHGRWRWGRNSMNQYGAWCTECECGWEDKGNDFDRVQGLVIAHKYCPNCGARMDGE